MTIQGELTFTGSTAQRSPIKDFNLVYNGSQGNTPVFDLVQSTDSNSQNMIILQAPNGGEISFDVNESSNFQTQSKGFGLNETTTNISGTTTKRGTVTVVKDPGGNNVNSGNIILILIGLAGVGFNILYWSIFLN